MGALASTKQRVDGVHIWRQLRCLLSVGAFALAGCGPGSQSVSPARSGPESCTYESLDRAFATAMETAADVAAYQRLIEGEDTGILDAALRQACGVTTPETTEATAITLLHYVAQVMKLEFSSVRTGSEFLAQGHGYCTGFALAYVALCRRAGFPARMNSFNNFGLMQGHNAAEVYYGGAWHFFDPTFGTFFYSHDTYNGLGCIPALRELMTTPQSRSNCFCFPGQLWTAIYDGPGKPISMPETYLNERYGYSLREFYEQLFTRAFPAASGSECAVSQPIDLDLRTTPEVWVGTVDANEQDMIGERINGQYARFHGATHLGKTRHATLFHTITLRTPAPGRYRLTYHFTGGKHEQLGIVELRSVIAGSVAATETTWSADLYLQDDVASFLIVNQSGQAYVDAIHAQRLSEPESAPLAK